MGRPCLQHHGDLEGRKFTDFNLNSRGTGCTVQWGWPRPRPPSEESAPPAARARGRAPPGSGPSRRGAWEGAQPVPHQALSVFRRGGGVGLPPASGETTSFTLRNMLHTRFPAGASWGVLCRGHFPRNFFRVLGDRPQSRHRSPCPVGAKKRAVFGQLGDHDAPLEDSGYCEPGQPPSGL